MYEKQILSELFLNKISNYINNVLKDKQMNLNLDKKLISKIVKSKNVDYIFKKKIEKVLDDIKNNREKCKIEHLNILIVGRHKIGKKQLIKYMLKFDDRDLSIKPVQVNDFKIFTSQKEPNIQLIKYKGIGDDKNNDPEIIAEKTVNYITKRDDDGNHNNFVHCIWYCISGIGIKEVEIEYLKKLKKAYQNVTVPIIIVSLNSEISIEKKEVINKELKFDYLKVIPKEIRRPNNAENTKPEGGDKLQELTKKKYYRCHRR